MSIEQRFFEGRADPTRARERIIPFRASTPTKDRHGTIIKSEGINTERFEKNSVFLWGHDGYGSMFGNGPSIDSVIGKVVKITKSPEALDIEVEFAPAEVNPAADMAFKMVKSGFLSAVSIGFIPKKQHIEQVKGEDGRETGVPMYDETELLEVSLVPIPSNPDALTLMRSIVSAALSGERRGDPAPGSATHPTGPDQTSEIAILARHMFDGEITQLKTDAAHSLLRIGKVLSKKSEDHIRTAKQHLDSCLAQIERDEENKGNESGQGADAPPAPARTVDAGAVTAAVVAAFRRDERKRQVLAAVRTALGA